MLLFFTHRWKRLTSGLWVFEIFHEALMKICQITWSHTMWVRLCKDLRILRTDKPWRKWPLSLWYWQLWQFPSQTGKYITHIPQNKTFNPSLCKAIEMMKIDMNSCVCMYIFKNPSACILVWNLYPIRCTHFSLSPIYTLTTKMIWTITFFSQKLREWF